MLTDKDLDAILERKSGQDVPVLVEEVERVRAEVVILKRFISQGYPESMTGPDLSDVLSDHERRLKALEAKGR